MHPALGKVVCSNRNLSKLRAMQQDCTARAQRCNVLLSSSSSSLRRQEGKSLQLSALLGRARQPWLITPEVFLILEHSQELSGLWLHTMRFSNKIPFSPGLSDAVSPSVKWEPHFSSAKGSMLRTAQVALLGVFGSSWIESRQDEGRLLLTAPFQREL